VSKTADRAGTRALRLLAREHYEEYAEIYEQVRPATPDRFQARNEARMQLRHRYPSRYLELHAQQEACPGTNVPAGIRSKSWQRATARLADLRAPRLPGPVRPVPRPGHEPADSLRPRHGHPPRRRQRPVHPDAHRGIPAMAHRQRDRNTQCQHTGHPRAGRGPACRPAH
jgi:hypothetical protein